jgi:hypothetical protein
MSEVLQPHGQGDGSAALQVYGEKYSEGLGRIGVTVEVFTTLYSQPIRVTPVRFDHRAVNR